MNSFHFMVLVLFFVGAALFGQTKKKWFIVTGVIVSILAMIWAGIQCQIGADPMHMHIALFGGVGWFGLLQRGWPRGN